MKKNFVKKISEKKIFREKHLFESILIVKDPFLPLFSYTGSKVTISWNPQPGRDSCAKLPIEDAMEASALELLKEAGISTNGSGPGFSWWIRA